MPPGNSSAPRRTTLTCSRPNASKTRALRRPEPGESGTPILCADIYTVWAYFCCSRSARIAVHAARSNMTPTRITNNCYAVDTVEYRRYEASGQHRACHVAALTYSNWRQRHELTRPRRRATVHSRPPRPCTAPFTSSKHHAKCRRCDIKKQLHRRPAVRARRPGS